MASQPCPDPCALGEGPDSRVMERQVNKFLDTLANTDELSEVVEGQRDVVPVVGGVFVDHALGPVFMMTSSVKKELPCESPCSTAKAPAGSGVAAPLSLPIIDRPVNKFLDTLADVDALKTMTDGQEKVVPVVGGVFIDHEFGPVFIMASSVEKRCDGICTSKFLSF